MNKEALGAVVKTVFTKTETQALIKTKVQWLIDWGHIVLSKP